MCHCYKTLLSLTLTRGNKSQRVLTRKYQTSLKNLFKWATFVYFVQPSEKKNLFQTSEKVVNLMKPFFLDTDGRGRGQYYKTFRNKLVFVVGKPTQVKHLLGAPLQGRLLALPRNIILGWKSLSRTKALAYYENS